MKTLGFLLLVVSSLPGVASAQGEPEWVYEYTADEKPQPGPDFTFRGVLICRTQGGPLSSRPVDRIVYQPGDPIGNGEVVYKGIGYPGFSGSYVFGSCWGDTGLITDETYYYTFFSYDESPLYSLGVATSGTTCRGTPTPMCYCGTPSPSPGASPIPPRTSSASHPAVSISPPPDVTNVKAEPHDESILLRWQNPRDLIGWGLEGTDCSSASSGIVTLDTVAPGGIKCYYSKAADFSTAAGFTVEFRMKVLQSRNADGRLRFRAVAEDANGHTNIIGLDFSESEIAFYFGPPNPYPMDTADDFHLYRIIGYRDHDNIFMYQCYVDGRGVAGWRLSNSNPDLDGVYFGDATGGGSQSQWDYIRYCYGAFPPPTPETSSPPTSPTPSPSPSSCCATSSPPTPSLTPTPEPSPTPTSEPTATPSPEPSATPNPSPTLVIPSPTPHPTCGPTLPPQKAVIASGDYDGNGTADIAVFRPSSGLWSIRNLTVGYYGISGDQAAPGDYDGDGSTDIAVFRGSSGEWLIRDSSRFSFGSSGDISVPKDYDGDGVDDVAVFRSGTGSWMIRDQASVSFGVNGDWPQPADYDGDGAAEIAIYRPRGGYWAISGLTRFFFGEATCRPLALDYDGDGLADPAVFRPCYGLWAIRNVTRVYLGSANDWPLPADYNGDGVDEAGIFRDVTGMWSARNLTRIYFGVTGDLPVTR